MIADDLAEYTYNLKYEDLSKDIIHEVKRRFIDSFGCAIAAKDSNPVKIVKRICKNNSLESSAFLYGTMIRYLDYNDTYLSKEPAHPSDNIGAVLGIAEHLKINGKNAILATALAYEIQCRLCDVASLRAHGWDHVIYGLASSGLAAGKIMELSKEQLKQTLNLTLTTYLSSRQVREASELSMWKACAFSNSVRNSIFSAILAKNGMTGPNNVFEGKYGLIRQTINNEFNVNLAKFGKRKSHFKIQDTWTKKWPAEIHSQSVIQAVLELRPNIIIDELSKIEIETHEAGYTIIGSGKEKWNPKTRETADHSIPYIVGSALMYGKIDLQTYSQKRLKNKELLNLVKKVSVKENASLTKMYPEAAANIVKVKLKSGKTIEKKVYYHRGHPKNKMTDEEIEEKFNSLTKNTISEKRRKEIINLIWSLDKLKNLIPIISVLK